MPRPRLRRRVRGKPNSNYFKPAGIPARELEDITLLPEEFESIRLVDYQNISQTEAGEKMNISQSTFSRILAQARKKISKAIIEGKAIQITFEPEEIEKIS